MLDRASLLDEIRQAAAENGGTAPSQLQFEKRTGVSQGQWRGKLWARWSDAVAEAGLMPLRMQEAFPDEVLLGHLAGLTLTLGRFPTSSELKMQRGRDKAFPNHGTFDRLGARAARIAKVQAFARGRAEYAALLDILGPGDDDHAEAPQQPDGEALRDGFVYMLKLGKHYKVGMTIDVPRRHRQIALELPEKPNVVHSIRTDDPEGIEAYWHKRFASKQTNGEWFALDAKDLRAFKRRKFM